MPDHKETSYSDGFGIFNKISEEEFDVPNKNYLRLFMLNTENKLFTYDELYEYILPNVSRYVFSRKYLAEAENNPRKRETMIMPIEDCCDMQKYYRYLMLRPTKTLLNK